MPWKATMATGAAVGTGAALAGFAVRYAPAWPGPTGPGQPR
jgi:hypothetical protein